MPSPVTIRSKILPQKLKEEKYNWDDNLPANHVEYWNSLYNDLTSLHEIKFNRFLRITSRSKLHIFADASSSAYATCIYLSNEDDQTTNLIFGKARVAPTEKKLSIPRLELLATLISIRALKFILKAINLPETTKHVVWSDSKAVFSWIKSMKILPTFIEHRVKEIRTVKNIEFRYVPSKENPADIPSRECSLETLRESTWFVGPPWLHEPNIWPKNENYDIDETILKEEKIQETVILPAIPRQSQSLFGLNLANFKSLTHLQRVTGYVIRFIRKTRLIRNAEPLKKWNFLPTEAILDFVLALRFWIQIEQRNSFSDVIKDLQNDLVRKLSTTFSRWK